MFESSAIAMWAGSFHLLLYYLSSKFILYCWMLSFCRIMRVEWQLTNRIKVYDKTKQQWPLLAASRDTTPLCEFMSLQILGWIRRYFSVCQERWLQCRNKYAIFTLQWEITVLQNWFSEVLKESHPKYLNIRQNASLCSFWQRSPMPSTLSAFLPCCSRGRHRHPIQKRKRMNNR